MRKSVWVTWPCSPLRLERLNRREEKLLASLLVSACSCDIFRLRQVFCCLFAFLRQFNHFLYEKMQPFGPDPLLTLHAAKHRRAFAIEVTEFTELQRHWPPCLITHIAANLLQQLSVFEVACPFNLEHTPGIYGNAFGT